MKRLLLLPVLALFISSCSTDDDSLNLQTESSNTGRPASKDSVLGLDCVESITGAVFVNYPGGFGSDAQLAFVADATGGDAGTYMVRLEIETLSDCENIEEGNNDVTIAAGASVSNPNSNNVTLNVAASSLPANCYRWRFNFYRKAQNRLNPGCYSYSPWYEAPLF